MRFKFEVNFKVGTLIKFLVLSDLALMAGWGLIEPVFAVFIIQKIPGATLATVGISASFYWIIKSIIELPIANAIDRSRNARVDFYLLVGSLFLASATAVLFLLVNTSWQLYLAQMLHGVAFGIYTAAWSSLFSHHLDKERQSFDWSLDSTAVGVSAGISGLVGGLLANAFGFEAIFVLAAICTIVAAFFVLAVPSITLPPPTAKPLIIEEKKL